jgi:hypothetical protein
MRAFLVTTLIGLVSSVAMAADVTGHWEGAVDTPDGPFPLAFEFVVDGDTLSGSVESAMGKTALSNGKVLSDEEISFDVEFEGNVITHQGKVNGDEIAIASQGPWGEASYVIRRVVKTRP